MCTGVFSRLERIPSAIRCNAPLSNENNFTKNDFYATSHSPIDRRRVCCGSSSLRSTSDAESRPFSGGKPREEAPEKGGT